MVRRRDASLLDIVAEVLVGNLSASLAEVAEAAGIGRTTLHKHYPTRDDLLRAVGHRAISRWEQAVDGVSGDEPDGGLRAIVTALIPIGPQLAFLWRTPALERFADIKEHQHAVEERCLAIMRHAQQAGVLAPGVPGWWLLNTCYSLTYCAAESVADGLLAPREAPDVVLRTLLQGIGAP